MLPLTVRSLSGAIQSAMPSLLRSTVSPFASYS